MGLEGVILLRLRAIAGMLGEHRAFSLQEPLLIRLECALR
jgi:hypothetical protein